MRKTDKTHNAPTDDFDCRWVTAWLLIIEGPGRGNAFAVKGGGNRVGRGEENEIQLNFGDQTIPESPMCNLVFDLKTKKHYLLHPDSTINVSINGKPTGNQIALQGGEELCFGDTLARFIVFEGELFSWDWPED